MPFNCYMNLDTIRVKLACPQLFSVKRKTQAKHSQVQFTYHKVYWIPESSPLVQAWTNHVTDTADKWAAQSKSKPQVFGC